MGSHHPQGEVAAVHTILKQFLRCWVEVLTRPDPPQPSHLAGGLSTSQPKEFDSRSSETADSSITRVQRDDKDEVRGPSGLVRWGLIDPQNNR